MSDEPEDDEELEEDLVEEESKGNIALRPNENADDRTVVERLVPAKIRERYEIVSYRNAAVILSQARNSEFEDILKALEEFNLTTQMIRKAGGNESDIPKEFSKVLRPLGWHETIISADLDVTLKWKEPISSKAKKQKYEKKSRIIKREKYLDGHKIDYVKGKVAFDLEWNSKDQTFDRDLFAMNAFFQSGAIDVGVLVTRSVALDDVFRTVGPALSKKGVVEKDRNGNERPTMSKYGASTTWMGKLIYRLNAGRNGGCPVLAVGITPKVVTDWKSPGKG